MEATYNIGHDIHHAQNPDATFPDRHQKGTSTRLAPCKEAWMPRGCCVPRALPGWPVRKRKGGERREEGRGAMRGIGLRKAGINAVDVNTKM